MLSNMIFIGSTTGVFCVVVEWSWLLIGRSICYCKLFARRALSAEELIVRCTRFSSTGARPHRHRRESVPPLNGDDDTPPQLHLAAHRHRRDDDSQYQYSSGFWSVRKLNTIASHIYKSRTAADKHPTRSYSHHTAALTHTNARAADWNAAAAAPTRPNHRHHRTHSLYFGLAAAIVVNMSSLLRLRGVVVAAVAPKVQQQVSITAGLR